MGKRQGWKKGNGKRSKKQDVWRDPVEIVDNGNFKKYYEIQNILSKEELDIMLETFKKDLPTTFRINPNEPSSEVIKHRLETEFQFDKPIEFEGNSIRSPFPLPWYPNHGAWQLDIHRKKVRKCEELKPLHQYIISLHQSNQIGRQEAVSMIPPLMLQAQPGEVVLDMCAAPGSKTIQLIEAVDGNIRRTSDGASDWMKRSGVVVANDADAKRAYLLVHQTHNLNTPNLLVTTHLGQIYPNFYSLKIKDGVKIEGVPEGEKAPGVFDRVLCDVPCSGDGTLRKTPQLWGSFNPKFARGLHPLQVKITLRGLALLKVGGTLVYSTCSLNPIEDEAVVSEVLRRANGSVVIKDMTNHLPELKRRSGIYSWKVLDNNLNTVEKFEDVKESEKRSYRASMWPGKEEELKELHIERCMRFYPHLQDTGGFFVCVLEKVAPLYNKKKEEAAANANANTNAATNATNEDDDDSIDDVLDVEDEITPDADTPITNEEEEKEEEKNEEEEEEKEEKEDETNDNDDNNEENGELKGIKKEFKSKSKNEEKLYKWSQAEKDSLISYYGIDPSFDWDGLYSRSENCKLLLYVSPKIRDLSLNSPSCDRIRLVHTGLRMFEKNTRTTECPYRICQDGLCIVKEYIQKRKVSVNKEVMINILNSQANPIKIEDFDESLREQFNKLEVGSCIVELDNETKQNLAEKFPQFSEYFNEISCVVWKGVRNINALISRVEIDAFIRALTM